MFEVRRDGLGHPEYLLHENAAKTGRALLVRPPWAPGEPWDVQVLDKFGNVYAAVHLHKEDLMAMLRAIEAEESPAGEQGEDRS